MLNQFIRETKYQTDIALLFTHNMFLVWKHRNHIDEPYRYLDARSGAPVTYSKTHAHG